MLISFQVLSLIFMSAFTGACILVGALLVPFWQSMEPAVFLIWFSAWAPKIVSVMLLMETLGMLFGLITCKKIWNYRNSARILWLISTIFFLLTFVLFFTYFIKTNMSMSSGAIDPLELSNELKVWGLLHWLRTGFSGLAIIFGFLSVPKNYTVVLRPF